MNAVTLMFEFLALSSIFLEWIPLQLCSTSFKKILKYRVFKSFSPRAASHLLLILKTQQRLHEAIWPTPSWEELIYLSEACSRCLILCFQYIIEQFAAGTFFCLYLHLHAQPFANGRKKRRLRWRGRRKCTKWILLWTAADKSWVWFWTHHKQRSPPI